MDSVYYSPPNFLSPTIKKSHFSIFCGWLACDLPWFICLSLSRVWLFSTPWTIACQALLFMGLPRQSYCHFLLHCHDWRPWIAILCWSWINPFHAVEITGRLFILGQQDDYFFLLSGWTQLLPRIIYKISTNSNQFQLHFLWNDFLEILSVVE